MQYLCLIYNAPNEAPTDEEEFQEMMQGYFAFNAEAEAAGVFVGGEALEGVDTATTVQVRDGETILTDGPFAETKEHLGGYYLLDCESFEQALEFAAKIPGARYGKVEVRPVMVIPGDG